MHLTYHTMEKTYSSNAAEAVNSVLHPLLTHSIVKEEISLRLTANGAGSKFRGEHHIEQLVSSEVAMLAVRVLQCNE